MALINCSECGHQVSDKAAACPKCGNPIAAALPQTPPPVVPPPKNKASPFRAVLGTLAIICLVVVGLAVINGGDHVPSQTSSGEPMPASESEPTQQPAPAKTSGTCKQDDLQCLGDKGVVGASIYCKDAVERLATHSVRWTDGTFELKFSHFRWLDKTNGTITFIGDKAEFQNGFGAYTPVTYECDMAPDNKTVLDVRAHEGRLPPD
jgi:hypothetical protein